MREAYRQTWIQAFNWKGRMQKGVYLKGILMHILLAWIPTLAIAMLEIDNIFSLIFMIFFEMTIIPILCCSVQRLHDGGKSGWWLLLYIATAPFIVGNVLFLVEATNKSDGDNKWGKSCQEKTLIRKKADDELYEEETFVDEYVTEEEIKGNRKKLIRNIILILLITIGYFVISEILRMLMYGMALEDILYDYVFWY